MKYSQKNLWRKAQRGVVLFIALIALMVMALAAVVLVRSVDTATLIAGNLAFKQSATAAADSGVAAAVSWLQTTRVAQTLDPTASAANTFNQDSPSTGYYSSITSPTSLTADATWAVAASLPGSGANFDANGLDSVTGNTVRYIIQRMCRTANQLLSAAQCLLTDDTAALSGGGNKRGFLEHEADLRISGVFTTIRPIYRITARVTGPKNSVSYIQTFAY